MAAAKENDEYRESIKKLQNGTLSSLEDNKCNSFRSDQRFVQLNNSEQICKDFKSLSNSMVSFQDERAGDSTRHISDCGFLNYWLNDKLRYDGNDVLNYVKNFYDVLKEDNNFDKKKLLKDKIYDIDVQELKNLRLLYKLYENLYEIIAIIGNKPRSQINICAYYTSTCVEEYKEAKILCNDEDSIFCKALDEFRASYISVQNDPNDEKGCHLNTLGKLPTNEEILLHRSTLLGGKSKNMVVSLIGSVFCFSFTFMLFYRFTPLGPWTKAKIRKLIKGGSNKKEWENQLIHSDIEKVKVHLEQDRYNIEYRSAGNF